MSTERQETTEPEFKALGLLEVKDAEKGEVEAIIATLGVVDHDWDIIAEGAIPDGSKAKLSTYGHDAVFGEAPVGKGTITTEGNKAVFRGRFFLSTTRGTEAFRTLKELGTDQEWSFGYRVMGSEAPDDEQRGKGVQRILTKLDAFEVSPVLRGAGIGTGTVAVKAADPPPPPDPPVKPDEAEVARLASEAETKRLADEAEVKRLTEAATREYERFQRTRRWLGA